MVYFRVGINSFVLIYQYNLVAPNDRIHDMTIYRRHVSLIRVAILFIESADRYPCL